MEVIFRNHNMASDNPQIDDIYLAALEKVEQVKAIYRSRRIAPQSAAGAHEKYWDLTIQKRSIR